MCLLLPVAVVELAFWNLVSSIDLTAGRGPSGAAAGLREAAPHALGAGPALFLWPCL